MANKTITLPEGAIVGSMKMTAKIGEKTLKGAVRKQNVFDCDFGAVAISGNLYGKVDAEEYEVILIPKANKPAPAPAPAKK